MLERQKKEKIDTERRKISGGQEFPRLGKPTGRTGTYFCGEKKTSRQNYRKMKRTLKRETDREKKAHMRARIRRKISIVM